MSQRIVPYLRKASEVGALSPADISLFGASYAPQVNAAARAALAA